MTNRLKYPTYWASGGEAVDPDLDTTNPSYIPNRYESVGWEAEKPPEQWQNYLSQISDIKIIWVLKFGFIAWEVTTSYEIGALVSYNGGYYVKRAGGDSSLTPDVSGSGWYLCEFGTSAEYNSKLNSISDKYDKHLSAVNPHNDNVDNIIGGTFNKQWIDNTFGDTTSPTTITYHILRTGAVHGETLVQLGTLPTSGGTFTGKVTLLMGIMKSDGVGVFPWNGGTAIQSGNKRIVTGISGSRPAVCTDNDRDDIVTEETYNIFNSKFNPEFALPQPIISINFFWSLSDGAGIGNWVVQSVPSDIPDFDSNGSLLFRKTNYAIIGMSYSSNSTIVVVGYNNDGVRTVFVKDFTSPVRIESVWSALQAVGGTELKSVSSITAYPTLSLYQKSMLAR